jgi:hypothetical protein
MGITYDMDARALATRRVPAATTAGRFADLMLIYSWPGQLQLAVQG